MGLVNRTGAWYQLDDGTKVQGRDGFIERVKEDLVLQEQIQAKVINA